MLREFGRATLIGLLALLLLVPGCVDEKEFTRARLECVDLASRAFARVPECDTQDECFSELEARLFNFPDEQLEFTVRQELFEYKNRIARSWLNYNLARERADRIRDICLSGSGFESLPGLSNELNHFLLLAFEDGDKANYQSIVVLMLEGSDLEREEVGKIREEQLFDVYAKIQNNLDVLSFFDGTVDSDTYFARMFKKIREFNLAGRGAGFEEIVLREYGAEEILLPFSDITAREYVKEHKGEVYFMPFLGDAFASFLAFLADAKDLGQSLEILRASPAFEFLGIYSDLVGERDSVLAEFASIMKEDCLSRKFLESEHAQLEKDIRKKISLASGKIASIPFDEFSYLDENFFFSLYSLLAEETPFSYREFDFESVREGWQKSRKTLGGIEFSFHSIQSAKLTGSVSLGESTSSLKETSIALDKLNKSLDYIKENLLLGIVEKCGERIPLIESRLGEIAKLDPENKFFYSRGVVAERTSSFKKSATMGGRIHYCYESLKGLEGLEDAIRDWEREEQRVKKKIGSCLDTLDLYLPILEDTDKELFGSISKFKESLSFDGLGTEPGFACSSFLSMAEDSIREEMGVAGIEEEYSASLGLLDKLRVLLEKAPALEGESSIEALEKEASELGAFFSGKRLVLEKALDSIHSIRWRVSELNRKLEGEVEKLLSRYISERVEIVSSPAPEAVLGQAFEDSKRISFLNPFFHWGRPFSLSFPFKHEFEGVQRKSDNISDFHVRNSSALVQFSSLPEGTSFAEVFSSAEASFTETDRLVQLDAEHAEIEKRIAIKSRVMISRLKAVLPLNCGDLNVSRLRAFVSGKGVPVFLEKCNAVFFLENLAPETSVYLYYVLLEPLLLEKSLVKTREIDENRSEQEYLFAVTNRLSFTAKNLTVIFPFPYRKEYVESIEFFDSEGKEKNASLLPNSLAFKVDSLLPGQRREFFARLRINDERGYIGGVLEQTRDRLETLSNAQNPHTLEQAKKLLGELGKIGGLDFRENRDRILELFFLAGELEKRERLDSELDSQLSFHEEELRERISFFRKEQEKAGLLGFTEYAEELGALLGRCEARLREARETRPTDKQRAFALLAEAMVALEEFNAADLLGGMENQAQTYYEGIVERAAEWGSLGLDPGRIGPMREEALRLLSDFRAFAGRAEFSNARQRTEDLKGLSEETEALFESGVKARADEIVRRINEFLEVHASASSKIARLRAELESVPYEAINATKLFLPVDLEEIGRIERELEQGYSKYKRLFEEILSLAGSGNAEEVIRKAKGIDFSALIEGIAKKEEFIDSSNKSIKAYALSSLSEARDKRNYFDEDGIFSLEESVAEAHKNNYLKSLVLSRTALASLKEPQELDWSYALFPVFIVLVVLFFRAYKKAKRPQIRFYRRVPRQY